MSKKMVKEGKEERIENRKEEESNKGKKEGKKEVVGINGEKGKELKASSEEAVYDYLETCNAVSKTPLKPYSGKLMLRIRPEIHAAVATAAALSGQSINQWASEALNREASL